MTERPDLNDRTVLEALTALHRAVAVRQFYPENHSMQREAVKEGLRALRRTEGDYRWEEAGIQLRSGALWFGHSRLGEGSPAVGTLARTLSIHGVAALRRRGDVSEDTYRELVSLLATSPEVLAPRGGAVQVWRGSSHGEVLELRGLSVSAEDREASEGAGRERSREAEGEGGLAPGGEASHPSSPALLLWLRAMRQEKPPDARLRDLLLRLEQAKELTVFQGLLREVGRVIEGYVGEERFREAYEVVVFLYRLAQAVEGEGKAASRGHLLDAIRVAVQGRFLGWLIERVAARRGEGEEAELGDRVLRVLAGAAVVPVINALVAEGSRLGRRRLVDVLVSLGDAAVPWASKMLEDQRWFVVRNMVTVLGGIASPEAHRALTRPAASPDARIRREVARALARGKGPTAEEHLILLLGDREPGVRLLAISAAANHPSGEILEALEETFRRTRISSAAWSGKAAALGSIGRLGLPGGVRILAEVLHARPLLWPKRWRVLQRAAVQALGDLGGAAAVELLSSLREHRDPALCAEVRKALVAAEKG